MYSDSDSEYIIWSNQHKSYWKPNSMGYSIDIREAGIYSLKEVIRICDGATYDWNNKIPNELPIQIESLPYTARIQIKKKTRLEDIE